MTHLRALYDAAKDGQSRGLQIAILAGVAGIECPGLFERGYMGDTQAAIDFVHAVLPEAEWGMSSNGSAWVEPLEAMDKIAEWADTPARALLLAALIAKGEK